MYRSTTYIIKNLNERLNELSINDYLDVSWFSGKDLANGPRRLCHNARAEINLFFEGHNF